MYPVHKEQIERVKIKTVFSHKADGLRQLKFVSGGSNPPRAETSNSRSEPKFSVFSVLG
jgi:hypothetical protein